MSIIYSISRRAFFVSSLSALFMPCTTTFGKNLEASPSFSFAFISDCHLSSRLADNFILLQESQLFLQDAVRQINLLKPDFVIFGGDQVQGTGQDDVNWQLFLDIVQSLNCPWHFILGETDISGDPPINKMHTFGRDWKGKGLSNHEPYWSCDPVSGLHLIGLDTSQANSLTGHIDEAQLDWLKEDISKNDSAITLIVSHHPLLSPNNFYNKDYLLAQAPAIMPILERATGQVISISGHTHLSKIQWQNNICYISSPSLTVYPCAFRLFRVSPENVQVETFQVNFPALVKKAKINLANSSLADSLGSSKANNLIHLAEGNRTDQNAILSLKDAGKIEGHSRETVSH